MNFEELLLATIAANQIRRESVQASRQSDVMSRSAYNREYKTVHLNGGRQTGKTTLMCRLARKGDLIVVHNEDTLHSIIRNYPNLLGQVITAQRLLNKFSCGRNLGNTGISYDYIWIDEPHHVGWEAVYTAWELKANQFVLLGE